MLSWHNYDHYFILWLGEEVGPDYRRCNGEEVIPHNEIKILIKKRKLMLGNQNHQMSMMLNIFQIPTYHLTSIVSALLLSITHQITLKSSSFVMHPWKV